MAWIRERKRKDGGITYLVTWREPGATKESTLSIADDKAQAELNVRILEANGNSYAAAERALSLSKIDGPKVAEYMLRHVALLTTAGPDQTKRYERAIKNHFSSKLGKLPLAAVVEEDVILWVKYMQTKGLSSKTIANHHGLLSAAMSRAQRAGLLAINPCGGINLPKDESIEEKMRFMTVKESLAVVQAHPVRYRPLVAFLRGTGARFGEATALTGGDFQLDIEQPTVRIEKAWKRGKDDRFYIGPPKTKKSRRSISLPPSLVDFIRPAVEAAGKRGTVFVTSYGGPIRHSTFFEFWKKSLDKLGYPAGERPRIHDLRHTHASIMLAGGPNTPGLAITELSRRLGHESIQTTVDRYSHLMPDAQFRAADIAEKVFGKMPELPPIEGPDTDV